MAEGYLKSLDPELEVFSAGVAPADAVNPLAIKVMDEIGIDIRSQFPKTVDIFMNEPFDYVITVCDNAKENCPVFYGKVKNYLHYSIPDPIEATGTDEERLSVYRKTRDQIRQVLDQLFPI
jgi:arsenate reductase